MSTPAADPGTIGSQLHGRWLKVARAGWLTAAVLMIGVFIASQPLRYAELREVCTAAFEVCEAERRLSPDSISVLQALGISVEIYAIAIMALGVVAALVWSLVGLLIFVRKSNDRMALLAALALVTFGIGFNSGVEVLARMFPAWWLPDKIQSIIAFVSIILFLYLFPSGHFVPGWTRWFALAWIVGDILSVFSDLLPAWFAPIGFVLFLVPAICGIGAQVYRYRRESDPVQRRQTQWVVFGIVAGFGSFVALALAANVIWGLENPRSGLLLNFAPLLLLTIPVSIGIAILRYRLFDIDIIIRRTLVYSTLTLILALVYVGCIVLSRALVAPFTGGSDLAIVASTLAIAALFTPLRRRIQNLIDRRFYRRKYDAAKVLAAFAATARDETDLERLTAELVRVADETMQPEFVGLWMREPGNEVKR